MHAKLPLGKAGGLGVSVPIIDGRERNDSGPTKLFDFARPKKSEPSNFEDVASFGVCSLGSVFEVPRQIRGSVPIRARQIWIRPRQI